MAQSSIVFSTALDNTELETALADAKSKVESLKKELGKKTGERNAIVEQLEDANKAIEDTKARIESLKARREELRASGEGSAARIEVVNAEISKAITLWENQITKAEKLDSQLAKTDDSIDQYTRRLDNAQREYVELGNEAQRQAAKSNGAFQGAANGISSKMTQVAQGVKGQFANMANSLSSPFETLQKKIVGMFKKVFVFSIILKGIRSLKSEISSMLSANNQFNASVENLKAVMRGYLASAVSTLLPALIAIVNTIAGIFQSIAGLIDSIFGTGIVQAIQAQRDQASANIQQANAQASADYAEKAAAAENKQAKAAKKLAKEQQKANRQLLSFDELNILVAESAENAADATDGGYDPSTIAAPELATDWTSGFVPDFGIFQQLIDWLETIKQRILTDSEGAFARIREGLELIKVGFDELVQGIMSGNWSLVWQGLVDIVVGALYVIEGAFDAFLGWLDETTGGRFSGIIQGVEQTLHGLIEVAEGLLRGDLGLLLQGVLDTVDGVLNIALGEVELTITKIEDFVNLLFGWLSEKFPEMTPMFEGVKDALITVLEAAKSEVKRQLDVLKDIFKSAMDLIVGIFTGDGERIRAGLRRIVNGLASAVEGALNGLLDGAFGMINGAIDGLNTLPGVNFGFLYPPTIRIPRLANGAVIPPNREFMAVLGDQASGRNIEAPESLIRQIVREENGNAALVGLLQQILGAIEDGKTLQCDGYTLARVVNQNNKINGKIYGGAW